MGSIPGLGRSCNYRAAKLSSCEGLHSRACAPQQESRGITTRERPRSPQLEEDRMQQQGPTHKWCPFHHRGLGCKNRKSRNTWSNRQIWPWSTEWSRAKVNRVLPRECTGHSKHSLPIIQDKTLHMYTPDGQYQNQIDYILCSQRWRSSI